MPNVTKAPPLFAPVRSQWTRTDKNFTCLLYPFAVTNYTGILHTLHACFVLSRRSTGKNSLFISQVSHYYVQLCTNENIECSQPSMFLEFSFDCWTLKNYGERTFNRSPCTLFFALVSLIFFFFFFTCDLLRWGGGRLWTAKGKIRIETIEVYINL